MTSGFWGERVVQVSSCRCLPANALAKAWPAQNKDLCGLGYEPPTHTRSARPARVTCLVGTDKIAGT